MAPSTPDFLRKRTTSTSSLSSSKFRSSVVSLASRASRDRLTSDDRPSPFTSGAASSSPVPKSPAASTSVSAVDLFAGAPLQTTTSPIGAASDLDPDFGSSYEGPASFHFASDPPSDIASSAIPKYPTANNAPSAASPSTGQMNSAYHNTNTHEGTWLGGGTPDHANLHPHGLSPHVLGSTHFGTSPGNQSDMSNEAQFHNNDALSDVSATGRSSSFSWFAAHISPQSTHAHCLAAIVHRLCLHFASSRLREPIRKSALLGRDQHVGSRPHRQPRCQPVPSIIRPRHSNVGRACILR